MATQKKHRNIFELFGANNEDSNEDSNEDYEEQSDSDEEYEPPQIAQDSVSSESSEEEATDIGVQTDGGQAGQADADETDRYYRGRDGTRWSKTPPPQGRSVARNIIRGPVRKVVNAENATSEMDYFKLFLTPTIIKDVVRFTNEEGARVMVERNHSADAWKQTDENEIWAMLGILLTCGHLKQNMVSVDVLWSKDYGPPILRATMSRRRFQDLMSMIRFDSKRSRELRRKRDKFAPIRDIWTLFEKELADHYIPGENLTVDEQLVPFRGRCSFVQYMPAKPDKYGIKLFWIADAANAYPLKCIPYLGKEGEHVQTGLGRKVTLDLCRPYYKTNRNVTADNFFTDHALAIELLSNGLTLVGTVRKNKRFLPPEFSSKKGQPLKQSIFGFSDKATVVNYQCKKAKSVTLISTMHYAATVDGSDEKKPEIVNFYNGTKGGVDTLDQMAHGYSVKRKTRRWPLAVFFNMIDIAGIAAYSAWMVTFPQWMASTPNSRRRTFLQMVAESMMRPHIQERGETSVPRAVQQDIRSVLDMEANVSPQGSQDTSQNQKRRRCCICPTKKDRKTKQICSQCTRNVCKDHCVVVCEDCKE